MRGLQGLFIRKITVTLMGLCIPLLFFPKALFTQLGIPMEGPMIFIRLLGVAYLALCVGYYSGITAIKNKQNPMAIIHMGLVSNGLAAAVFLYYGATGNWQDWSPFAQGYMWALTAGAAYICFGLGRAKKKYNSHSVAS